MRDESNNQLLKKYFDTFDPATYPDYTAEVCQLCSTAIEGGRNKQVEHLYIEHKKVVRSF